MTKMLPRHGRIECRICYEEGQTCATPHPAWRMKNDPGAWGGQQPRVLILGFSKGSTQTDIYASGNFDAVAFAGMRPRLQRLLRHCGLLPETQTIEDVITDPEGDLAFGSLVRCSLARRDDKSGKYACSGPLIVRSFKEIPGIIEACSRRFLTGLPDSVKVVALLGIDDGYIRSCQELLAKLFPDSFTVINGVAARADGRLWVHLPHPSPANGHFEKWFADEHNSKRQLAEEALGLCARVPCTAAPGGWHSRQKKTVKEESVDAAEKLTDSTARTGARHDAAVAETWLEERLHRTAEPTKYIAGFRLANGRELALERCPKDIRLWIEYVSGERPPVGEVVNVRHPGMPYSENQTRTSNLNGKNAPRLRLGRPVWYLRLYSVGELARLIEWYSATSTPVESF